MVCPNCGQENVADSAFCRHCGTRLTGLPEAEGVPAAGQSLEAERAPTASQLLEAEGIPAADQLPEAEGTPAAGQLPEETVPPTPMPPEGEPAARVRKKAWWAVVLAIVAAMALLAVIAFVVVRMVSRKGEEVLLAFPSGTGTVDLYLVELGKVKEDGLRLAQNVSPGTDLVTLSYRHSAGWWLRLGEGNGGEGNGAFIPETNQVYYWYEGENGTVLEGLAIGDEKPHQVLETEQDMGVEVRAGSDTAVMRESLDDIQRCYVAKFGQKAELLAEGNECDTQYNGFFVYYTQVDGEKTTLSTVDPDGKNKAVMLDGVENVQGYRLSKDGSHVAYAQATGAGYQLYKSARDSDTPEAIGTVVNTIYGFLLVGDEDVVLYLVGTDAGGSELYLSNTATTIVTGEDISAYVGPDGDYVVYQVTDENGRTAVYSRPVDGGESVELATAEETDYHLVQNGTRALVLTKDGSETHLYNADLEGEKVELFQSDKVGLDLAHYVLDESWLYLTGSDENGSVSLYVTSIDKADGFYLLEGWSSITLLNRSPDGRYLVLAGAQKADDNPALYSIRLEKGAQPVKLDDGEQYSYGRAAFTADGKAVVYTASTGDAEQDVEVRRAGVDGQKVPEVLYAGAELQDVRWDYLDPFVVVQWWY